MKKFHFYNNAIFCTGWPVKHGRVFMVPLKKSVRCTLLYTCTLDKSHFHKVPEKHCHVLLVTLQIKTFQKHIHSCIEDGQGNHHIYPGEDFGQPVLGVQVHVYRVMQWKTNSLWGYVVSDSFNMTNWDADSILDQVYQNKKFLTYIIKIWNSRMHC